MNELIEYCRECILPVLRNQPPPRYGDWNYPVLADDLERLVNAAQMQLAAPSFPSIMSSKPLND